MIKSVRYKNFKSLRTAQLDLERLTVIVGPNASGKTSLLQGLDYLSEALLHGQQEPKQGDAYHPTDVRSRGTEGAIELTWVDATAEVLFSAFPKESGWGYRLNVKPLSVPRPMESIRSKPAAAELSRSSSLLRLEPSKLAAPATKSRNTGFWLDGTGFASALADTALADPDLFQMIQSHVKRIVPSVNRVKFRRYSKINEIKKDSILHFIKYENDEDVSREVAYEQLVFDMDGAPGLPAPLVSEGTLLVLGLVATLLGPSRPKLLLLDDIDRALHPKAQRDLVGLLRLFLDQDPELQIVATSHSPYLLDQLRPEEVRLTTIREDGSSVCGSLVDHPDFERWKDEMAPGEMWSFFGEEWVANLKTAGN